MKNKLKLFCFLIILLSLLLPTSAFAQTFYSNCVVTKVGTGGAPPVLPPECASSGEIPSADRVALLAQVSQLVAQGKVTFSFDNDRLGMTNGTGQVRRIKNDDGTQGQMITIDTQLLRLYVYLANQGFTFNVSSMIGTHKKLSSSGNVSRHWDGHGADISSINGQSLIIPSTKQVTIQFLKSLNSLAGTDLAPRQVLCNGNGRVDPEVDAYSMNKGVLAPGFTLKYINSYDHQNHVHVGY